MKKMFGLLAALVVGVGCAGESLADVNLPCSTVVGHYTATAVVQYKGDVCHYSGSVYVIPNEVNIEEWGILPAPFTLASNLLDSEGRCQTPEQFSVPAFCSNGTFASSTPLAYLKGPISNDGNQIDLAGTISILLGTEPVSGNITMQLKK